jgi:hypothetical protein
MQPEDLTIEIATVAARLIAEEGLDYASAKRKALKLTGLGKARVELPNNALILEELRLYLNDFQSDTQLAELAQLRALAVVWMRRLEAYQPRLTGAVWNGTANTHSAVHLMLFTDDEKSLEIELINYAIDFQVSDVTHLDDGSRLPALVVQDKGVPIVLSIYPTRSKPVRMRDNETRYGALTAVEALLHTDANGANP